MRKTSRKNQSTSSANGNITTLESLENHVNGKFKYFNIKNNSNEFAKYLKIIENEANLNIICGEEIHSEYFKLDIKPFLKDMFLIESNVKPTKNNPSILAMVLGRPKNKENNKFFYIDLICVQNKFVDVFGTQKRKPPKFGKLFLNFVIQKLSTAQYGQYDKFALHASVPKLVQYYKELDFKRDQNACKPEENFSELDNEYQAIEGYDDLTLETLNNNENVRYVPSAEEKQRIKEIKREKMSQKPPRVRNYNYSRNSSSSSKRRKKWTPAQKQARKQLLALQKQPCNYMVEAKKSASDPNYRPDCILKHGWWMSKCNLNNQA